ncbi:MAG TPA: BamA/TamA family outer membrane protein [Longimicrobiales bacterium]
MLLLAGALGSAAPLRAQNEPEVHKISFSGARTFDEELLRAAIVSNQTRCKIFVLCWFGVTVDRQYVDEIGLRGDLVRLRLFYYQRGFRQAQVQLDTVRTGDGLDIQFRITEGTPVRVTGVAVNGLDEMPAPLQRTMRQSLPLAIGHAFSLIDYETARDTLSSRLADLGYARAEVLANYTIPRDSQYSARVEFEVIPGERVRFGDIAINGNENVSAAVIRRMLTFHQGDYYSNKELLRSQRNLFSLEAFRHVEIVADPKVTADTLVPVSVQVNKGNLHRVRFGIGMSTAEYINAEGLWTNRNFLGGARKFEVRARVYNIFGDVMRYISPPFENTRRPYNTLSGSLSADFSQPWFFDPLNTFNAGLYVERRSLPNIFVRSARGGYVTLQRSFSPGATFSFGYRPELTQLTAGGDLVFCVNLSVCGPDEIQVLRDPHWLSPVAVSFARDRSNSLLAPTSGNIIRFDGEYARKAVGSDFEYTRLIAEITDYSTLSKGVVLAARIRPGWARAFGEPGQGLGLHPQKRFFGGGPNSVRGFAQFRMGPKLLTANATEFLAQDSIPGHCTAQEINAGSCDVERFLNDEHRQSRLDVRPVGGEAVLEGNLELRMPFVWPTWRAVAFLDFGQVWRQPSQVHFRDVVFTPGFGFRYFSAIGPIRVDLGYNPNPAERLPVVTQKVICGQPSCTSPDIEPDQTYTADQLTNTNQLVTVGNILWNADRPWYDRFQLHFSIGQAF